MAPEHLFPAAFDDCLAVVSALTDVDEYSHDLGIDSQSISLLGDSAGGNLAAAISLRWRTTGRQNLRSQVLIYPVLQVLTFDLQSYVDENHPFFLNKDQVLFYMSTYLWGDTTLATALESKSLDLLPEETWGLVLRRLNGEDVDIELPPADIYPHAKHLLSESLSPLLARNTSGVVPAFIVVAGFDPLRSDGELYERKLRAHGNDVSFMKYKNEPHGFGAGISIPNASFLQRLLHNPNSDSLVRQIVKFTHLHAKAA